MSFVVALLLMVMTAAVVVLGRVMGRVGSGWIRPAHAPLWLVAGALVVGLGAATQALDHPAERLSRALRVAADGPGARLTHLALALALLLVAGLIVRVGFAALRRRRLDRGPVPGWFLLAGIGADGEPMRALRTRVFVGSLLITLLVAGAGAWAPRGLDTTLWAALVAGLTASALAFAPLPRRRAATIGETAASTGDADPHDDFEAIMQRLGATAPSERRPAVLGGATFPRRVVARARAEDTIVQAPIGAGKTGAGLALALEDALAGREVVWIAPTRAAADLAIARFASAPEAILLPPLTALTARELQALADDVHTHVRFERVVIDDADLLGGAELVALRQALNVLASASEAGARVLVLGVGDTLATVGRVLIGRAATLVAPEAREALPGAEVTRWLLERLPEPLPMAPRAVFMPLGAGNAHRYLAATPRYAQPTREVLALDRHAARRRALAPACPRPLVPKRVGTLPMAESVAASTTPIRTTKVRIVGTPTRTRHRFRGPGELELWAGRAEIRRVAEGDRLHDHDLVRAHTRLAPGGEPAFVADARVLVMPSGDPIVLHTLTHVVRELLPWFFRDARRVLGVTSASAGELGTSDGHGALVVHDLRTDAGVVGDIAEREWETLLLAARALLARCECASHCANCCESTTCTTSPHNVLLDRHRTLAVLDSLLVPQSARKVA